MKPLLLTLAVCFALFSVARTQTGDRVELKDRRGYSSKTFKNSDGSYSLEISLGYLHYKNDNGEFEEINRNFVPSAVDGYDYEITRGLYHTYFKSDISQPAAVAFETRGGAGLVSRPWAVAYLDISTKDYQILQQAQPSGAVVTGNSIVYPGVFTNVDVKYIYQDTRLKEELYLTQEARDHLPSPSTYGFAAAKTYLVFITEIDFDLPTVHPYAGDEDVQNVVYEGENRIDFRDLRGKLRYFFPVDKAFLASERDSAVMEHVTRIRKRIITRNGKKYLLSGVPLDWITSLPQGTVVFDPQVEIKPDVDCGKDAMVLHNTNPGYEYQDSTNYGDRDMLYIEAWTAGQEFYWRAYLKFELSAIPTGVDINSAVLNAFWHRRQELGTYYMHGSNNSGYYSNSSTYLRRVTSDWNEMEVTWASQPDTTHLHQVYVNAPSSGTSDFTVDVTNLVKDMRVNGNYGFQWMLENEYKYRSIYLGSSELADVNYRPKLVITYSMPQTVTYYIRDASGNVVATYKKNIQ